MNTGVHISAVVVANVNHIVITLHGTGQGLQSDVIRTAVAAECDEFVVFYPNCDERITDNFITAVSLELKKSNVSLSHGIIVTDPASGKSLDEYIVMADKEMYKIKQARKAK